MYYYNPYMMMYPLITNQSTSKGIFKSLFGRGINWSSILSNTGKTLNIINQTIPVVKEISPVMKNAKTMFRVMNEFKKLDTTNTQNKDTNQNKPKLIENNQEKEINQIKYIETNTNGPTFFI